MLYLHPPDLLALSSMFSNVSSVKEHRNAVLGQAPLVDLALMLIWLSMFLLRHVILKQHLHMHLLASLNQYMTGIYTII